MSEHKDTAGNTLRETRSGWEILQKGVGWRKFIGFTILTDGRMVDTREVQAVTQDVIEESQHKKQLEDDLFRHYAGIALESSNPHEIHEYRAQHCCDMAQAMIDELKKRGRL